MNRFSNYVSLTQSIISNNQFFVRTCQDLKLHNNFWTEMRQHDMWTEWAIATIIGCFCRRNYLQKDTIVVMNRV